MITKWIARIGLLVLASASLLIGTSFDRYAGNPLTTIPAYGASGVVHPDVVYIASGLDGYKYWMMYTPYPPDTMENPSIVRSNDGLTWTDAGISNPVVPHGATGTWNGGYNADPDFVYVPAYNKWFMAWSGYEGASGRRQTGFAYSSDGKQWTQYDGAPVNGNPNPILMSADDTNGQAWEKPAGVTKLTEPSLMYESGVFTIYYGEEQEGNNRGKAGFATFQWDDATHSVVNLVRYANNPTIDLPQDSVFKSGFGHRDLSRKDGLYYLYIVRELVDSASNYALELLTSPDKITWTNQGPVLQPGPPGSWDQTSIYRSAPVVDPGGNIVLFGGQMHLYYTAYPGSAQIGLAMSGEPTPPDHFSFVTIASPQSVGTPFQITITARDSSDNLLTSYTGQATLGASVGHIAPAVTGKFAAGAWSGTVTLDQVAASATLSAADGSAAGASNSFAVQAAPALDHFVFQTITSPQYVGAPFQITIGARDGADNPLPAYTGHTALSASVGSATPNVTGNFSAGTWTGKVALSQVAGSVTLTANDNGSGGTSNSFAVQAAPQYYQASSASNSQATGVPFAVTVTAFQTTINCWEDNHQEPVLATTTSSSDLIDTDGKWTEFKWSGRPFPGIFASVNETPTLPIMRFYAGGIPNGQYQVIANLFTSGTGRDMRYYYGHTPGDVRASSIDTVGGSGGSTMFTEYSLGTIDISDNSFNLYVKDADVLSGAYTFFGWAWIRLVPTGSSVTLSSSSATMRFDGNGNGSFGESGDNRKPLVNGTFSIPARDTAQGTGVVITALDDLGQTGSGTYNISVPTAVTLAAIRASAASDSAPLLPVALGLAGVLLAGGGFGLWRRRRRTTGR